MEEKDASQLTELTGICFMFVFIAIGYIVRFHKNILNNFDEYFMHVFRDKIYPSYNLFFTGISRLGDLPFVVTITFFCIVVLCVYGKRMEAIWMLAGTVIISGMLVPLFKKLYARPRPIMLQLINADGFSFPSGHAAVSIVLYGSLTILIGIYMKNHVMGRILQILLCVLIFGVGISRVYCGVHFPSDIIGGFILGGSWLFFTRHIFIKNYK